MKVLLVAPRFSEFSYWNYREVCELFEARYPAAPLGLITVAALLPREWDIRLDESLFLGGLDKSAFLEAFAADVFFDDQAGHCERARSVVPTGHVPHGIANE